MFWRLNIPFRIKIFLFWCVQLFSIHTATATPEILTIYCRDSFADTWGRQLTEHCAPHIRVVKLSGTGLLARLRLEGHKSPAGILLGIDTTQISDIVELGLASQFAYDTVDNNLPTPWPDTPLIPLAYDYLAILTHTATAPLTTLNDLLIHKAALIIPDPRLSTTGLEFLYWIQQIYGHQSRTFWTKLKEAIVTYPKGLSSSFALFLSSPRFVTIGYSLSAQYAHHHNPEHNFKINTIAGAPIQVYGAVVTPRGLQHAYASQVIAYLRSTSFQATILKQDYLYPAVAHSQSPDSACTANQPVGLLPPPQLSAREKADLIARWLKAY